MSLTKWNGFKGAAKRLTDYDIPRIGHRIGVGEDELHAFMEVEASGSGFDSQGRPKMLFEPHQFYKNLSGKQREQAVKEGLAYPSWGEKPYPKDSYPRLQKAIAINETAALKSASWGLGQILGSNYAMVGYKSPQSMVMSFMEDEANHLDAIVSFLIAADIADDLKAHRWEIVARVYNGPLYAKHDYHGRMKRAYEKWSKIPDTPWSPDMDESFNSRLNQDSPVVEKGIIETVQELLRRKGYHEVGEIDGIMGNRTRNSILSFQADNNLPLTGVVTDDLLASLVKAPHRSETPERSTATAEDLKGDAIVDLGNLMKKVGVAIVALGGVGGVSDGSFNLEGLIKTIIHADKVLTQLNDLSPWLLTVVVGVGGIHLGSRFIKQQVAAFREGRSLR